MIHPIVLDARRAADLVSRAEQIEFVSGLMDRLEAGESPDSIEQNMGESLGGPDDGGLGDEL